MTKGPADGGLNGVLQVNVQLEAADVNLFRKRAFAGVIKDLEMRSSWIIQVGAKSRDKCPYRREAEGHLRQRKEETEAT